MTLNQSKTETRNPEENPEDNWCRAIVRVWHGKPHENGTYLGTAFLITPEYLLTAQHVLKTVEDFSKVYLQTDREAWHGGGLRNIDTACLHLNRDVALLKLNKEAQNAYCIPISPFSAALEPGQSVKLAGFSTIDGTVECVTMPISGYLGSADLEITHTAIGKGFSGGPVIFDGKLVGIVRARAEDSTKTYLLPLHAFRDFLTILATQYQPIFVEELNQLIELLEHVNINESTVRKYFKLTVPDSRELDGSYSFFNCLSFLAQKSYIPPDHAPLLTFLDYCNDHIPPEVAAKLLVWKQEVATRLGIVLLDIRAQLKPIPIPPIVVLKILPEPPTSDDTFLVKAWRYQNGEYDPQMIPPPQGDSNREYFYKNELETNLPAIISHAGLGWSDVRLEVILPTCLFNWNLNRFAVKLGGRRKRDLSTRYPIVFRSWDRIYHQNYWEVYQDWQAKWLQCENLSPEKLHCLDKLDDICYEQLFDELQDKSQVFMLHSPLPTDCTHWNELLDTVIAAGIPLAFWPLQNCAALSSMQQEIETWFNDHHEWPEKVFEQRKGQDSWNDLVLLWDNPENLPPDAKHALISPAE